MSTNQENNPLHGITLEMALTQLVEHYGWEGLAQKIKINCFKSDPSINSSLKFLRKTQWARDKVESLYLYTFEKMTLENVAKDKKLEIGKAGAMTASNLVRSMRGELSRLAGRDYELFTAERLKTAGYDVKLGGRVSEPDIIAKMGTVHKVYSCKCLDYQRKTTISANEFRPEIQYALANGARMVLAIHNLHDSTDKYMEMDANDFPKIITLIP